MTHAKLLVAAICAAALAGCSSQTRFVTHIHEESPSTFYLAYTDSTKSMMGLSSSFTAHVRKCDEQPDKTVTCTEQAELNRLLNADNQRQ
jgi:hypothetical protein